MARLTFRQGIVRHGKNPGQSFFLQQNGVYVNMVVSPDLTIFALADGTKDYLFTESVSINQAWGPFPIPTQDYWLYWDINKITGVRTFGSTTYTPVNDVVSPPSPAVGQMWFDTSIGNFTSGQMLEWSGSSWVPVLRVFACKYVGNQFFSPVDGVSLETNFGGTQVGATGNGSRNVGSLAYDSSGKPIINQGGKFFTTEDVFTAGVPTGASLKVNNILLRAQAVVNIAAFQVVVFSQYNKIQLAAPFDFLDKVYGIVEENVVLNATGNVITEGVIFNDQWDFTDTVNNPNMSGAINDPIYITSTGELTTNINLSIPGQVPLGAVIGIQSILFSPGVYGTSGFGSGNDHGSLTGLTDDDHPQYYNQARGDVQYYPRTIADLIFAPITHQHLRADITDFAHLHVEADIQDLDKYTQAQADALFDAKVSVAGDSMTGQLILFTDPTLPLEAATKQYVDALAAGIDAKDAVHVATTNDLSGVYNPIAGTGSTGEFTNVNVNSLDGTRGVDYTLEFGNRVLVKDQITATQNGIYVVTDVSDPSLAILERAPDHDGTPASEVTPGNYTFISAGAVQAGSGWVVLAGTATGIDDTFQLNVDDMNWAAVSSATAYSSDGTTISIDLSNTISAVPASTGGQIDALMWNSESNTITTPVDNHVLIYNTATTDWRNDYLSVIRNASGLGNVTVDTSLTGGTVDNVKMEGFDLRIAANATLDMFSSTTNVISSSTTLLQSQGTINLRSYNGVGGSLESRISVSNSNGTNSRVILTADTVEFNSAVSSLTATTGLVLSVGNNDTTLRASGAIASSTAFVLPPTNGAAGEVLSTDGTGITSWIAGGGGGGGGSFVCLQDSDADAYVSVGFNGTPCVDAGTNHVYVQGGNAQAATTAGGNIYVAAGQGNGAIAGNASINGGSGGSSTRGGSASLAGGDGYGNFAGNVFVSAGNDTLFGGQAGTVYINGGNGPGYNPNTAGQVVISAGGVNGGSAYDGTTTADVIIQTASVSGKYKTGDIYLMPGGQYADTSYGGSNQGNVIIARSGNNTGGGFGYDLPTLQFNDTQQNFFSFRAPANIGTSTRVTLPVNPPNNNGEVLLVQTLSPSASQTDVALAWGAINVPYDIAAEGKGVLVDGDIILRFMAIKSFTLEGAALANAGIAGTAPAAQATFDVRVVTPAASNLVGTYTFAAGSTKASWASSAGNFSVVAGDFITIQAFTVNGIADVGLTIPGSV